MERGGEPGPDPGPPAGATVPRGGGVSVVPEPPRGTAIGLTLAGLVWRGLRKVWRISGNCEVYKNAEKFTKMWRSLQKTWRSLRRLKPYYQKYKAKRAMQLMVENPIFNPIFNPFNGYEITRGFSSIHYNG